MDTRLAHGDAAHLADPLVVGIAARGGGPPRGLEVPPDHQASRCALELWVPKGSVGAACVCWACLKIGREGVCLISI